MAMKLHLQSAQSAENTSNRHKMVMFTCMFTLLQNNHDMSHVCHCCTNFSSYHVRPPVTARLTHIPIPIKGRPLIRTWTFTPNIAGTRNLYSFSGRRVVLIKYIFSYLVTILCPLVSHWSIPVSHIKSPLISTFRLPFTHILSYHPNPPCVHPDSSDHRHTIRITMFCSLSLSQFYPRTCLRLTSVVPYPYAPWRRSEAPYISPWRDTEVVVCLSLSATQYFDLNYTLDIAINLYQIVPLRPMSSPPKLTPSAHMEFSHQPLLMTPFGEWSRTYGLPWTSRNCGSLENQPLSLVSNISSHDLIQCLVSIGDNTCCFRHFILQYAVNFLHCHHLHCGAAVPGFYYIHVRVSLFRPNSSSFTKDQIQRNTLPLQPKKNVDICPNVSAKSRDISGKLSEDCDYSRSIILRWQFSTNLSKSEFWAELFRWLTRESPGARMEQRHPAAGEQKSLNSNSRQKYINTQVNNIQREE